MYRIETDRHPGRRIWFGSLSDTVSGLEVKGRVKLKPRMLKIAPDHWIRLDVEEVLFLERTLKGTTRWVTLRGSFEDLDAPGFPEALEKARQTGVFVQISPHHAVAPTRIVGIRLQRRGNHELDMEGPQGEPVTLPVEPWRLRGLEECLDVINLGGGFLITGPDED